MEDKIVKDISLDNKYLINLNQPEEKIEMLLKKMLLKKMFKVLNQF